MNELNAAHSTQTSISIFPSLLDLLYNGSNECPLCNFEDLSHSESGGGHATCFGQWGSSILDANRGLQKDIYGVFVFILDCLGCYNKIP